MEMALDEDVTVLVIEDDPDIQELLHALLRRAGYGVVDATTGREGLRTFHQSRPELVILDVGLPDLAGWEVLERIRDMSDVPVLVLTARASDRDKVRGLHGGADDYLTKPFSRDELLARLVAIRRRRSSGASPSTNYADDRLRIDFSQCTVSLDNRPIQLTPTEFRLLCALVRHSGQVLSQDELVELAWNGRAGLGHDRVKYAVLRLRRKLDWDSPDASPLETVRGFGYRYQPKEAV
jgi:DNA-binding response OmpR family regulator